MLNRSVLVRATAIGTLLQLAMVIAGHFVPYIALHVFVFGGMAISALAGFLAGRGETGYGGAVVSGAVAGAVCAAIGIAVSVLLKDTPATILVLGTASSAVTGLIGGALARAVAGTRNATA